MTTQEIVNKLWNLCNVLRDDGITYHQYVTELAYILFLKMATVTSWDEEIKAENPLKIFTGNLPIQLSMILKKKFILLSIPTKS